MKFEVPTFFIRGKHWRLIIAGALCLCAGSCATSRQSTVPLTAKQVPSTGNVDRQADTVSVLQGQLPKATFSAATGHPVPKEVPLLQRQLPEATFDGGTLKSALDFVGELADVRFDVDWSGLAAAGIHPDTPISGTRLRNVTLYEAIEVILNDARPINHLWWHVDITRDGSILIATHDQYVKTNTITRVYDLRDIFRSSTDPATGLALPFGPYHKKLADQICKLITDTVAPDSWVDAGGAPGAIGETGGFVIVRQTRENHASLQNLLEQLRPTRGAPAAAGGN